MQVLNGLVAEVVLRRLIPRLHSVCFAFNDTEKYSTLLGRLSNLAHRDLCAGNGYFPGQRPPEKNLQHARGVVASTLLRHQHTRGRYDIHWDRARSSEYTAALAKDFLEFFSGVWRVPCLQHFCDGSSLQSPRW